MRYFGPSLHHYHHFFAKGRLPIQIDDKPEPGSYHSISLQSIFNRIFEKLKYHRLKTFLGKNNILFKSQYGFREKHSTQHAIIDSVNVIQNNMDQKFFTFGIFFDLKKAFDTVDH